MQSEHGREAKHMKASSGKKLLILVNYSSHKLHHMLLLDLIHVTLDTEVQVEHLMLERQTV